MVNWEESRGLNRWTGWLEGEEVHFFWFGLVWLEIYYLVTNFFLLQLVTVVTTQRWNCQRARAIGWSFTMELHNIVIKLGFDRDLIVIWSLAVWSAVQQIQLSG